MATKRAAQGCGSPAHAYQPDAAGTTHAGPLAARQRDNDQPGQAPSADARRAGKARRHPGTHREAGAGAASPAGIVLAKPGWKVIGLAALAGTDQPRW